MFISLEVGPEAIVVVLAVRLASVAVVWREQTALPIPVVAVVLTPLMVEILLAMAVPVLLS